MICVESFPLGPFQMNSHVVYDDQTREAVLFDTGRDPQPVLDFIQANGLDLKLLLYTHAHLDHVEGHAAIRAKYPQIPCYIHAEEQFWIDGLATQAQMFHMPEPAPPQITRFIDEGERFTLDAFEIEVFHTPGHTPGGICYFIPQGPVLMAGDTIFYGSIGRTDFPRGDYDTLMASITQKVLTRPDETRIYSGHGPVTTVSRERAENPFLQSYTASPL